MTVDSVATPCLFVPAAMNIIDDELIIANIRQDTLFYVFDLPSLSYSRSGGVIGPAPEELTTGGSLALTTKKIHHNLLSVIDETGHSVKIIEPKDLTVTGQEPLLIPADWYYVQNYQFMSDGRQLMQQGQLPMAWAIVNSGNHIDRAIEPQLPEDVNAWATDDMNKIFVRTAHGAVSDKHKAIAIVSSALPIIDFYDFDGNHKSRVIGEYTLGQRLFKTGIYVQATDDLLYVNYHDPADTENTRSTIAVFDWDGNRVDAYQVGILVTTFAVDEKNHKIYFTSDNENDNLYWFDI